MWSELRHRWPDGLRLRHQQSNGLWLWYCPAPAGKAAPTTAPAKAPEAAPLPAAPKADPSAAISNRGIYQLSATNTL